jgi:hypothetical protein
VAEKSSLRNRVRRVESEEAAAAHGELALTAPRFEVRDSGSLGEGGGGEGFIVDEIEEFDEGWLAW